MTTKSFWSALIAMLLLLVVFQTPVSAESYHGTPASVSPSQASLQLPNDGTELSEKIEIARIRSGLLPGVIIGGRYEGILKIVQERYTASDELEERLEDAAHRLIEDELSQSGYSVVRSPFHSVFEEQITDESEPGRFLLGGTITAVKLNSYSSLLGDNTHDHHTIRWEVFDREAGKVIYRRELTGIAQVEGLQNPAATYEAIRNSFRALLAEPDFTETLKQSALPEVPSSSTSYEIAATSASPTSLAVEQIASRSIPSVVRIRTPGGRGSGFLLNSNLVITNQHVVGSAFTVKVDFFDGSTRAGKVIKRDRSTDVALLKLEGSSVNLPGLPICQTNAVKVGQPVVAIGNPLSFSNTVTQGVVSGIRVISNRTLLQTDAAVNPGNSGGPLFNRQGTVIGIVTEKVASRGVEGLGFALPIAESLQKLNVTVKTPVWARLDACGNPSARV